MRIAYILGAGFSRLSGLPIQSEFSTLLLAAEFSSALDKAITEALGTFLADVFGWRQGQAIPSLEDVFTSIDLSANTGHHLGIKYTPKKLRALRRMAIYRVFSVLDRRFSYSSTISELLDHSVKSAGTDPPSFIVLSWDIVLEKHLEHRHPRPRIEYCCDALDWNNPTIEPPDQLLGAVPICKMHGSSNWVYCENCGTLFFDLNEKISLHKKVGLIKADFRLFDESFTDRSFDESLGIDPEARQCRRCNNMISSHIATFSYRKSFRTHAYPAIWHRAGEILADATRWVFVGYSLPKADFELKHLLKTAQLRYKHISGKPPKKIDVVVKGGAAREEFGKFFGADQFAYFDEGLEQYVASLNGTTASSNSAQT
jgi:hypothetical protein